MPISLADLPFADDALEPHMSKETFDFHHGKHHRAYVNKTNSLIEGTDLDDKPLEDIVLAAHNQNDTGLFNQAAQAWNHGFFWNCLSPEKTSPGSDLAAHIDRDFGGLDEFKDQFKQAATGQFGSGWAWLVLDGTKLKVINTANAGLPQTQGMTPLLTLDVWEHAYYLDHRNDRGAFVDTFLNTLINWDFVEANYRAALETA